MVFQLFALLFIAIFIGKAIDSKISWSDSLFTALLPVLGLLAYFFKLYKDVSKD